MSFADERKVPVRERRIGTLSHFNGTLASLRDEVYGGELRPRIRTFTQVFYDEILSAISVLSKIEDIAVIIHGAVGCSACGLFYNETKNFHWYSSNLDETDTILGGDEKLCQAISRAHEEVHPKAIFIVGTPVIAINNDDVNSLILEMENELGVKMIYVNTDGFKSKTYATGFDIVSHSLLRYVIDRKLTEKNEKEDFINVISFSENEENLAAVAGIFRDLDIKYHLLPQYADIDVIAKAGKARASVTLNAGEGAYFAEELEEIFHVPYVRTESPVGIRATRDFITKIAKQLDIGEKASEYINEQEKRACKYLEKPILAGKKVFIDAYLEQIPGFAEMVEQFGGTIEGIGIPFIDMENYVNLDKIKNINGSVSAVIANGQPFEKVNVITQKRIDYYIGNQTGIAFAAIEGCAGICTLKTAFYAYEGVRQLSGQISRKGICPGGMNRSIYKPAWLKKSSNWYVKQEVR